MRKTRSGHQKSLAGVGGFYCIFMGIFRRAVTLANLARTRVGELAFSGCAWRADPAAAFSNSFACGGAVHARQVQGQTRGHAARGEYLHRCSA